MTSRSRNRFKLWLKHLCTAICFSPCIWPLANLAINDSTWALSRMSLCPSPVDKLCIQIALRKCGHKMTQFWEKTKWRWSIKPIYEDDKKSLKRCKAVQWRKMVVFSTTDKHRKHVKTDLWSLSLAGAFPYLPCYIQFSRPPVTQCGPALSSLKYGSRDFGSKFTAHVIGNDFIFVPMYYESLAADLLRFGKVVKFIV